MQHVQCYRIAAVLKVNYSTLFFLHTARENYEFSFPASATVGNTMCLNVTIMDDDYVENTDQLEYRLIVTNDDATGDFDTHTITLEDNDGKYSLCNHSV